MLPDLEATHTRGIGFSFPLVPLLHQVFWRILLFQQSSNLSRSTVWISFGLQEVARVHVHSLAASSQQLSIGTRISNRDFCWNFHYFQIFTRNTFPCSSGITILIQEVVWSSKRDGTSTSTLFPPIVLQTFLPPRQGRIVRCFWSTLLHNIPLRLLEVVSLRFFRWWKSMEELSKFYQIQTCFGA